MKLTKTLVALVASTLMGLGSGQLASADTQPPKLLVQITIDALRGDFLTRYDYLFAKSGGFKRLLDKGYWYQNAHYQHANTETIVGHTSLATGAPPSVHGMIANAWFDRQEDRLIYNIEDANYSLLTPGAGVDQKNEIDHTQRTAKNDGRSPARILSTTLSDEIFLASNGKAKVFAVSVKDRGAVSMAGHSGKAFWFSKANGQFVTTSYYYDRYPAWTEALNQNKPASRYADTAWDLTRKAEDYAFIHDDDQSFETALPGFGRVFPHAFGPANNKYFNTFLTLSPAGDELTLDFAKTLIQNENLGVDDTTDYLGISFSSNDYVGHVFGGSSLENEDNLVRLDKTLGELFSFLDKKVGLKNTVIVLSADHG